MGKTCAVGGCKVGYRGTPKGTPIYSFPVNEQERKRWTNALVNVINDDKDLTNVGVCEKHWPPNFPREKKKGSNRPANPPSVFDDVPKSFRPQTLQTIPRRLKDRKIDFESRQPKIDPIDPKIDPIDPNVIDSWEALKKYCIPLPFYTVEEDNCICLTKLEGMPPQASYCIQITKELKVNCFYRSSPVPTRHLVGKFSAKLETYSQLASIIEMMDTLQPNLKEELIAASKHLQALNADNADQNNYHRINFLCEQMELNAVNNHGERYNGNTMRESINLYLRSRNCYSALRDLLVLPHKNTITSYFGKLGSPGSNKECSVVMKKVFSSLNGMEKHCKILVDEIHIKPGAQYEGGHIIGYAEDEPDKIANTVLALMVAPLMGKPAFVARLIPVHSLKADFLYDQIVHLLKIIHEASGFVFLVMNDNLRANQKMFSTFHQNFTSKSIYSVAHPIHNKEYKELFLLYDPVHLLKNIRNNWCTEKMQKLKYTDPETKKTAIACWSDLVYVYKQESEGIIKQSKLDFTTLYPNNFDKQKVSLALNIFNEKTIAALRLEGREETARFIEIVTRMWNMLNAKSVNVGKRLNDPDRYAFTSSEDERFLFLKDVATMFKEMDVYCASSNTRVMGLTSDTSNALLVTLLGICEVIKTLLSKRMKYVLTGHLQSDRLEAEFGIYRQQSGGNYNISVQQVINSLRVRRIDLLNKLDVKGSNVHLANECCKQNLTPTEIECLDHCFENTSSITENERSSLFHIAGYVAFKEPSSSTLLDESELVTDGESKFTELVSRGRLKYPSENLFDLSLYLYAYYKSINDHKCINKLLLAFEKIYNCTGYDIENYQSVLRRFANSFNKAFTKKITDSVKRKKCKKSNSTKRDNVKKTRLSGMQ